MAKPLRFFIVHLHKTAGTSLRDRFKATLPDSAIYPNRTDGYGARAASSTKMLLERWAVRRDEVRLIAGHFPLSTVNLLGAPFITIGLARPPVERVLSYLRQQKMMNAADRELSLEEIYDEPIRFHAVIRNHMLRMYSISAEEIKAGDGMFTDVPDTRERLELAKKNIAAVDALGLQPCFEEFWKEFSNRYDLELGEPLKRNITDHFEASDSLIERIRKDNALDIELYEFAEWLYRERGPLR